MSQFVFFSQPFAVRRHGSNNAAVSRGSTWDWNGPRSISQALASRTVSRPSVMKSFCTEFSCEGTFHIDAKFVPPHVEAKTAGKYISNNTSLRRCLRFSPNVESRLRQLASTGSWSFRLFPTEIGDCKPISVEDFRRWYATTSSSAAR